MLKILAKNIKLFLKRAEMKNALAYYRVVSVTQ
jgi:hypothetical protein